MPKTIQSLHVSHHFDDMRAQWITLFQLAIHQGSPDVEPFGPSLNLKHALKTLDHIESPNVFELLLQLGLHRSQHEAADLSRLILEFMIGILSSSGGIISRFLWKGFLSDIFLFIMLENNSQVSIPGSKVCSIQFIFIKDGFQRKIGSWSRWCH